MLKYHGGKKKKKKIRFLVLYKYYIPFPYIYIYVYGEKIKECLLCNYGNVCGQCIHITCVSRCQKRKQTPQTLEKAKSPNLPDDYER